MTLLRAAPVCELSCLIAEDRADFVVPADYTDGSQLDITIQCHQEVVALRGEG